MAIRSKLTNARRLRDARGNSTLQTFVQQLNTQDSQLNVQPSTLYRYEDGTLPNIPAAILRAAAALSKKDLTEFDQPTGRDVVMRVVISPLLDSAFLKFVCAPGVLEDVVQDQLPPLNVEFMEAPYGADLKLLLNRQADVCLHNRLQARTAFKSKSSIFRSVGTAVRYRGYGVLASTDLPHLTVGTAANLRREPRGGELNEVVPQWLRQLFEQRPKTLRWFVASKTDMQEISVEMLQLLKTHAGDSKKVKKALDALAKSAKRSKSDETTAFSAFARVIGKPGYFFLGGLAQRLAAEDKGATLVLDHGEMLMLIPRTNAVLREMLSPDNHIWVSSDFERNDRDAVEDLKYRWKAAVLWITDTRRTLRLVDAYIQEQLRYAQRVVSPSERPEWEPAADYFSLAVRRNLIELLPSLPAD